LDAGIPNVSGIKFGGAACIQVGRDDRCFFVFVFEVGFECTNRNVFVAICFWALQRSIEVVFVKRTRIINDVQSISLRINFRFLTTFSTSILLR